MQRNGSAASQERSGCLPKDAGAASAQSGGSFEAKLIGLVKRMRASIRPDVRTWLDGFGLFLAITLFFCLVEAAHDGITKRQRAFDDQRWWYPIYKVLGGK
jgi:hypothetical protein